MNIRHCRNRWIAIFFFFFFQPFLTETRSFHKIVHWNFSLWLRFYLIISLIQIPLFLAGLWHHLSVIKILKVFQNPLVIYSNLFCLNTLHPYIINSAKNIIKCQLSNKFQRVLFFFELSILPTRWQLIRPTWPRSCCLCVNFRTKEKGLILKPAHFCQNIWLSKFRKI